MTVKSTEGERIMNPENKITQSHENDDICTIHVPVRTCDSFYGTDPVIPGGDRGVLCGVFPLSSRSRWRCSLIRCMRRLGAATGVLVFSEIMLGQFGGLGELEKFLTVTIGVYIAGRIVKNPMKRGTVAFASIFGVIVQQFMGCVVDILKVQFAVEEFEAVPGLPESVFFTEGFSFLNDVLFSGILFCMLPTMYLVPKLLWQDRAAAWHETEG